MVLICIFLMMSDVKILSCVSWLSGYLPWKKVYSCLLPIFNWIFCFISVECYMLFIFLDTIPLSDMSFANIFSYSIGCLLVLLVVSFSVWKLFILVKSQQFMFPFVSHASQEFSSKTLLWPMSKRLLS